MSDLIIGSCCACRQRRRLRHIAMLDKHAPIPGTGWGCVVCELPSDGAIAMLCDACATAGAAIVDACYGYVKDSRRTPITELAGVHRHNQTAHDAFERRIAAPRPDPAAPWRP